jgi:hypothetical protein
MGTMMFFFCEVCTFCDTVGPIAPVVKTLNLLPCEGGIRGDPFLLTQGHFPLVSRISPASGQS